jgi:hypothetical protein
LTLTLPGGPAAEESGDSRGGLRLLVAHGPLRRVSLATVLTSFSFGAVPAVIAVVLGARLHGSGATLAAAFGVGNLAGSLLVTARPLRGEPVVLTARAVAAMAGALALCAVAPTYPLALGAFGVAGAANAPFVAATLAGRARYSPPAARAHVFVGLAAVKVAAAAAGSALAAAAIGIGPRALLAAGAAITLAGAATCGLSLDSSLTHEAEDALPGVG